MAGGGFSGAKVANGLGEAGIEVTLVSSDNFLLFTPMLAEAAVGDVDPRHIIAPLRQLAPKAQIVQGLIESIDVGNRSLQVSPLFEGESRSISGDVLVIAIGSVSNTYGVPGVEEFGLPFKSILDALRIRNRILAQMEARGTARVAVVGAGYSGAEVSAALADFLSEIHTRFYPSGTPPKVFLVDAVDRVTPALPPSLSAAAARALAQRGVELALGSAVASLESDGLTLANGRRVKADNILWAAGVKAHPLLARSGIATDHGFLAVDGYFRTVSERVFALGDAAHSPSGGGGLSPPTAQFALRQGRYLGRNLGAIVSGERVAPFRYRTKGELVSLGHHNAVGQVFGVGVSGLLAWFLWRSYYLLQLPTMLRRTRVAIDWTLDVFFPPDIAWLPSSDLGPL